MTVAIVVIWGLTGAWVGFLASMVVALRHEFRRPRHCPECGHAHSAEDVIRLRDNPPESWDGFCEEMRWQVAISESPTMAYGSVEL